MSGERSVPPLRAGVFWVVAAWIALSPGLVQVLHLDVPLVREWRMYSSVGGGVCDVTYFDGDTAIDRIRTLYDAEWWQVAASQRRVGREDIVPVAWQLCAALDVEDLRADATCAGARMWRPVHDRQQNLCVADRWKRPRGKRRSR